MTNLAEVSIYPLDKFVTLHKAFELEWSLEILVLVGLDLFIALVSQSLLVLGKVM